ncbi:hypothetical protein [Xenorhabdus sp. IM139775]|uniref:hypothetical protein n=1 Tax=Xenorhabdus sp. IM139775 TaxID=3025876 RepID=UPI002358DA39|nr:hypothetical protein [Xenorhabdus sp. IM139775]MDC9594295.1 hypothetical protein [Xenorhabdus sp. IM139775]
MKNYCAVCDKPLPKSLFPVQKMGNGQIGFSAETGTVIELNENRALIACEDGEQDWFDIDVLTLESIPNDITRALLGECKCETHKEGCHEH